MSSLVNGVAANTISINNRGLAYGDGLFETIKVTSGKPEYFDLHIQRLEIGLARLNINCNVALVKNDAELLLADKNSINGVLKITVMRGFSGRGYMGSPDSGCDRIVEFIVGDNDYYKNQKAGVNVRLCDTRLSTNSKLAGMKHLGRLENVLARSEWNDDLIAEGLLLDTSERVIEGTMSNLFICSDSQLQTPLLDRCGVEGIVRNLIVNKLSPELDVNMKECNLTLDEVIAAEEIFLCNSLIGIWPVINLMGHKKSIGPITLKVQQSLQADLEL